MMTPVLYQCTISNKIIIMLSIYIHATKSKSMVIYVHIFIVNSTVIIVYINLAKSCLQTFVTIPIHVCPFFLHIHVVHLSALFFAVILTVYVCTHACEKSGCIN